MQRSIDLDRRSVLRVFGPKGLNGPLLVLALIVASKQHNAHGVKRVSGCADG